MCPVTVCYHGYFFKSHESNGCFGLEILVLNRLLNLLKKYVLKISMNIHQNGSVKNLTDRFLFFSKKFLFIQFMLFNLIYLFAPSYVLKILFIFPEKVTLNNNSTNCFYLEFSCFWVNYGYFKFF